MRTQTLWLAAGIIVVSQCATAQWTETSGPNNVPVWCIVGRGTSIFAGTGPCGPYEGGIFLSTDSGSSWTPANNGLTSYTVRAFAVNGTSLFAGTYGGIFRSAGNGASWVPANIGLTNNRVHALAVSRNATDSGRANLFAGTYGGIYLSTNDGTSWSRVNNGLTNPDVMALAVSPSPSEASSPTIYAGTYGGGVYVSSNDGANWSAANTGLTNKYVYALAVGDSFLFAGTYGGGAFRSSNNGATWLETNSGLTNTSIHSLLVNGPDLFAATDAGVFYSADNGECWEAADPALITASILTMGLHDNCVFAGTRGAGIWRCQLTEMKTMGVEHSDARSPSQFALLQNYPNPFNPTTVISCQLPVASMVRLVVYDVLGREVAVLMDEYKAPGTYRIEFSAQSGSASGGDGAKFSSGAYLYRLNAGVYVESKRMMLLR